MFCPKCGFDLGEQDLNFCKNCGNPLKEKLSVPNQQTAGTFPPSSTLPPRQRDMSSPESVLPQPHSKPHVSSRQQVPRNFYYSPTHQQVFTEQRHQESSTRKRRRLLTILIPVLVLIIAAEIYLIFFSGLTGKKLTNNEESKLSFESVNEGDQKNFNNKSKSLDTSSISESEDKQRTLIKESDNLDTTSESTVTREYKEVELESKEPDPNIAVSPYSTQSGVKREYKEIGLHSKEPAGFIYSLFTDGTIEIKVMVHCHEHKTETSLNIPREIDGLLVTSIGSSACRGCSHLTEIIIPDSVTSIGNRAFADCTSLTKITIPDSVINIDSMAFASCDSLTTAVIPYQLEYCGSGVFPKNTDIRDHSGQSRPLYAQEDEYEYTILNQPYTGLVYCYQGNAEKVHIPEMIGGKWVVYLDSAFHYNEDITDVIIPDSVTRIGENAFAECNSLSEIIIPDSVTSIDDYAFFCCESLTEIKLPDSVTSIGDWAFWNCESLTEITIPDSVTSIGSWAFRFCDSLTQIHFTGSREQWELLTKDVDIGADAEVIFGK